jgi:glucose/mannose-6-phosphate isomerase
MTFEEMFAVDTSNMYRLLREFPVQVKEAVRIGTSASLTLNVRGIENVVLSGLGGSAIGGDLLRSYLAGELKVPFTVNRHYTLPAFVGARSLVILSSYSGNTEETNAAHKEAIRRKARIVCISSNGVTAKLALSRKSALIKVPGGLPPRAALGYSFFPLLITLTRLGLAGNKSRAIRETIGVLDAKSVEYGNPDPAANKALQLAEQLRGHLTVIYSSTERFDAVNTRWRGQIAENGKSLAFGHVLPEMNHNELVGWKVLKDQMRDMQVVFLRDKDDHKRVQVRMDITKQIIGEYTSHITEVWSEGTSVLARIFSLVYLGDWVSYYLSILNGEDPTPVRVIDHLKEELGKI